MQWTDWPFLLSQVLSQFSIGAFIVISVIMLSGKLCFGQSDRVLKSFPLIWLLLITAMLLREGTLMLSQIHSQSSFGLETFFCLTILISTMAYWLCEKHLIGSDKWRKSFLFLVVVWSSLYFIEGVINHGISYLLAIQFIANVIIGGSLVAHCMLVKSEHKLTKLNTFLPVCGLVLGVVTILSNMQGMSLLAYQAELGDLTGFVVRISSIGLMVLALSLWFMPIITKSKPVTVMLVISSVVMSVASFFMALSM